MDKQLTELLKRESSYLGDGLYAHYDGYQIRLFSSNGIEIREQVFLDSETTHFFVSYVERLNEKKNAGVHKADNEDDTIPYAF